MSIEINSCIYFYVQRDSQIHYSQLKWECRIHRILSPYCFTVSLHVFFSISPLCLSSFFGRITSEINAWPA